MIVKVLKVFPVGGGYPKVLVQDKEATVRFEGELPEDIAIVMGPRQVAFFHAKVDTQRRISLGADAGWQEW